MDLQKMLTIRTNQQSMVAAKRMDKVMEVMLTLFQIMRLR
jgi:hypothetical protein